MDKICLRYYDADLGKCTHVCNLDLDKFKAMLGCIVYDYYFDKLKCSNEQKQFLQESLGQVMYDFDNDGNIVEEYREDIDYYLFKYKLYEKIC